MLYYLALYCKVILPNERREQKICDNCHNLVSSTVHLNLWDNADNHLGRDGKRRIFKESKNWERKLGNIQLGS